MRRRKVEISDAVLKATRVMPRDRPRVDQVLRMAVQGGCSACCRRAVAGPLPV